LNEGDLAGKHDGLQVYSTSHLLHLKGRDRPTAAATTVDSFESLLNPITSDRFFAEFHGRRWLHVPGWDDKNASVINWDEIGQILSAGGWNHHSVRLMIDTEVFPPTSYCRHTVDRNEHPIFEPQPEKVFELLRRGASIILLDIESLAPGVLAVIEIIERELAAKCTANLYYSQNSSRALNVHFDSHDVYALQIYGCKTWRLYEGKELNPIGRADIQHISQSGNEEHCGRVDEEVIMRPGSLLYIPRGRYHDALADTADSVHVSIACNEPNGLDWLARFWDRLVADPAFRANLPLLRATDHRDAMAHHIDDLVARLKDLSLEPTDLDDAIQFRRDYRLYRPKFNLPYRAPPPDS